MRVRALSVGEGSCYVVQPGGPSGSGGVWVFDCGSQGDWDVGERRVVPALRRLGVGRIDTLVISHADVDHYNGVLDVADAMPIGRVLTSPQVLAAAAVDRAGGRDTPLRAVIDGLVARGIAIEAIAAGWAEQAGSGVGDRAGEGASVACLWPPAGATFERDNDASVVLRWRYAGRVVRLSGDVQDEAIEAMRRAGVDLSADVADLPHHGAFSERSPQLLAATQARLVIQSSGPRRLADDPWPRVLASMGAERWATAEAGMVTVTIEREGAIRVAGYLDGGRER
jgi:competence protein ComEC